MSSASVILICHEAPFGKAMAAALHGRFGQGLTGVLAINRKPSRKQRLKNTVLDFVRRDRFVTQIERIEATLERDAQAVFLKEATPPADWPSGVPILRVADPNGEEAVAWLADLMPDVIAVTGAPILRPRVFEIPKYGTLNMHSSLLPHYRGTQAEFWQVLEGRLETAGLTIHFVDAGVDTGKIIRQEQTSANPGISPQMLRTRNLLSALTVVPEAIASLLDGSATPFKQEQGKAAKRGKDKTPEKRAALLTKLGFDIAGFRDQA